MLVVEADSTVEHLASHAVYALPSTFLNTGTAFSMSSMRPSEMRAHVFRGVGPSKSRAGL
jgi:hypothetical protein